MTEPLLNPTSRPGPFVLHHGGGSAGVPRSRPPSGLRAVDAAATVTPRTAESAFSTSVGELAGRSLGTDFTAPGLRLGAHVAREAPALLRPDRAGLSAAAIVFVLAEHVRLFDYSCVTRTSFADELGTTLPALRRRVAVVQPLLAPHLPSVPDPDDE